MVYNLIKSINKLNSCQFYINISAKLVIQLLSKSSLKRIYLINLEMEILFFNITNSALQIVCELEDVIVLSFVKEKVS